MTQTERLSAALAGRYRIERELGAGGMATVYLAHDIKHERRVAIKVLKPELAAVLGAERFVVEIKTTAMLQHPHILPLFDSGTTTSHPERSEGSAVQGSTFLYYVMPYLEGETIRERLNRETQFGVDEAIRIAREVADALDYAHRHGVIHRDIKPENILLHDGRAIVMDFGIALAVSAAAGGRMTETGLSLGTPHYMSPEQATAEKDLTPRSDIYSLASVLYEMLAGQPPHIGGAAQQVIMKIITETAQPVTALRKSVPTHVSGAIAKALEKVPADRFETAKAFSDALVNTTFSSAGATGHVEREHKSVSRIAFVATAAVAVLTSIGLVWSLSKPTVVVDEPVVRVMVDLPPGERFHPAQGGSTIAISPQGDRVVYVAQGISAARMMIRHTGELAARELTSTMGSMPAFSPDGRWIAYVDGAQLKRVSVDGGSSSTLATVPTGNFRGLSWTAGDTILIGSDAGMFAVPSKGGAPRRVPGVDSTAPALYPAVLPDGKTVAYTTGGVSASRRLAVTSAAAQRTTVLETAAAVVLGMREGHLLYVTSSGELDAAPFDAEQQRLTGDPIHVESGIRLTAPGAALAALSASGSLWYATGQAAGHLIRVAADRAETRLVDEQRTFKNPRISPDGRKVAVELSTSVGSNIWLYDLANGTFTPLSTEGANSFAEWSTDGKRVVYWSVRDGKPPAVYWQPVDGSAAAEVLYRPDVSFNEAILSPDGKWLLYRTSPGLHNRDIFAVPLDGDRKPKLLVGGPAHESHPRLSPNGKWLAYQSNESGRFEVYVKPFPDVAAGARVQVSAQGGAEPLWSRAGDVIFYRTPSGGLESAAVAVGATFAIRERRDVLPPAGYLNDITHASYDVWPDGSGFLMVKPVGGDANPILVHNWGRALREKLAAGRR